ncbi:MAG TPA: hypothetical protein VF950_29380 [Planctomycetota bacterium]
MGTLDEKREIKKATDEWLPAKNKELAELSGGGGMTFDVDWATFAGDLQGLNWLEFNGPQQVVNAFRMIGTDDLGKEALRGAVKKIVVKNVPDEKSKALAMDAGVFTLTCAFAKSPGGRFTHDAIRDFLMTKL